MGQAALRGVGRGWMDQASAVQLLEAAIVVLCISKLLWGGLCR